MWTLNKQVINNINWLQQLCFIMTVSLLLRSHVIKVIQKWLKLNKERLSSWLVLASPQWRMSDLRPSSLVTCTNLNAAADPTCRKWYVSNLITCWFGWLWHAWHKYCYSALLEIHPLPLVFTLVSCNCPSIENWNHKWLQTC